MIDTEVAQRGFAGSVVIALPSAGSIPLVSLAFINSPFFGCLQLGVSFRGWNLVLGALVLLQPKGTRHWCRPGFGWCPVFIKLIPHTLF